MKLKTLILVCAILALMACGNASTSATDDEIITVADIGSTLCSGIIHKGPLATVGTNIEITEYGSQNTTTLNKTSYAASISNDTIASGTESTSTSEFSTTLSDETVAVRVYVSGDMLNEFYDADDIVSPGYSRADNDIEIPIILRSISAVHDGNYNTNIVTELVYLRAESNLNQGTLSTDMLSEYTSEVLDSLNLSAMSDISDASYASDDSIAGELLAVSNMYMYSSIAGQTNRDYDEFINSMLDVTVSAKSDNVLDYKMANHEEISSDAYTEYTGKIDPITRRRELISKCSTGVESLNSYTEITDLLDGDGTLSDDVIDICVNYFDNVIDTSATWDTDIVDDVDGIISIRHSFLDCDGMSGGKTMFMTEYMTDIYCDSGAGLDCFSYSNYKAVMDSLRDSGCLE